MATTIGAARFLGLAAGLLFLVATAGLAGGREPFATWFYSFAWWSYILAADAWVYQRRGDSLVLGRFPEFLTMLPVSVTGWLIFEAYNLVLGNWRYVGVPGSLPLRWAGYWLAFATVLPGLSVTAALLESLGLFRGAAVRPRDLPAWWPAASVGVGLVCLVYPLVRPQYGFPLVWLGFIFLLEPVCWLAGGKSYARELSRGRVREVLLLLAAGLVCGCLWEFWNYWAKAKWIYTLPYFQWGRVFEMPVLGYLGFPPFAVEAAVMYNFYQILQRWTENSRRRRRVLGLVQMVFWLVMFGVMDCVTVVAFQEY